MLAQGDASAYLPPHKSFLFNDFAAAVMDDELLVYRGRESPARSGHDSLRMNLMRARSKRVK
jgi:hypothetical protein